MLRCRQLDSRGRREAGEVSGSTQGATNGGTRTQALVIGCGYLGERLLARLRARGRRVQATVRRTEHAQALAARGVPAEALDVLAPAPLEQLLEACEPGACEVFYLVPPGAGGSEVLVEGARRVVALLARRPPRRVVVASSTAVYGDCGGARVDADSPARPAEERGRRLLEGEAAWRESGLEVRVVRLAGLYGPGRIVGERELRAGRALGGDPAHWLNLIEVSDAAALLLAVAEAEGAAAVELGCDGTPVRRADYYAGLARRLGLEAPRFEGGAAGSARAGDRRCDNTPTCARTGWRPRYRDWREGIEATLGAPG